MLQYIRGIYMYRINLFYWITFYHHRFKIYLFINYPFPETESCTTVFLGNENRDKSALCPACTCVFVMRNIIWWDYIVCQLHLKLTSQKYNLAASSTYEW